MTCFRGTSTLKVSPVPGVQRKGLPGGRPCWEPDWGSGVWGRSARPGMSRCAGGGRRRSLGSLPAGQAAAASFSLGGARVRIPPSALVMSTFFSVFGFLAAASGARGLLPGLGGDCLLDQGDDGHVGGVAAALAAQLEHAGIAAGALGCSACPRTSKRPWRVARAAVTTRAAWRRAARSPFFA